MTREEAINVVKSNWPDSSYTRLREALETLIPELKESEDERIRKWIITEIKKTYDYENPTSAEHVGKAIAWLEKQGEQKHAEWSDEERKKLDRIYSILGIAADEHAYSSTCRLIGDKEAVELQYFLCSIAKPQPKQKWSEEDEKKLSFLITLMDDWARERRAYPILPSNSASEYRDWLKSLRPQPHWKPSDEQMKSLDVCCRGFTDNADGTLQSLYSDLQKL